MTAFVGAASKTILRWLSWETMINGGDGVQGENRDRKSQEGRRFGPENAARHRRSAKHTYRGAFAVSQRSYLGVICPQTEDIGQWTRNCAKSEGKCEESGQAKTRLPGRLKERTQRAGNGGRLVRRAPEGLTLDRHARSDQ